LTSLAVGAYGLFAADYAGRVVWEFDLSGSLLGRLGQGDGSDRGPRFILSTPHFDVAAGEDTVWVSNPGRRRIEAYGLDGSLKGHWGQPSTQIDGFCGKSNPSHFARLPDGRFVTSETGMRRVKIYSPNGRFLGMVAPDGAFGRGEAGPPVAVDREGQVFVLDPTAREVSVYVEKGPDE